MKAVPNKAFDTFPRLARVITSRNRIVSTIRKHVIAQEALAGRSKCIGVEEAAEGGVVIAGLEMVQPGFGVVDIAAVAKGIMVPRVEAMSPEMISYYIPPFKNSFSVQSAQ